MKMVSRKFDHIFFSLKPHGYYRVHYINLKVNFPNKLLLLTIVIKIYNNIISKFINIASFLFLNWLSHLCDCFDFII